MSAVWRFMLHLYRPGYLYCMPCWGLPVIWWVTYVVTYAVTYAMLGTSCYTVRAEYALYMVPFALRYIVGIWFFISQLWTTGCIMKLCRSYIVQTLCCSARSVALWSVLIPLPSMWCKTYHKCHTWHPLLTFRTLSLDRRKDTVKYLIRLQI